MIGESVCERFVTVAKTCIQVRSCKNDLHRIVSGKSWHTVHHRSVVSCQSFVYVVIMKCSLFSA